MPIDLLVFLAVLITAVWFATNQGQVPERIAAALLASDALVDLILFSDEGAKPFATLNQGIVIADLVLLAAYIALALRANRAWPMAVAASQLIASSSHLAMFAEDGMQRAYWAMSQLPLIMQITALVLGTNAHRKREARVGVYRNWRDERTQFKSSGTIQA